MVPEFPTPARRVYAGPLPRPPGKPNRVRTGRLQATLSRGRTRLSTKPSGAGDGKGPGRSALGATGPSLKTHQRGPRVVLRSLTVEGVDQEAWGFYCVHYALRGLVAAAADDKRAAHRALALPEPDGFSFLDSRSAAPLACVLPNRKEFHAVLAPVLP